MCLKCKQKCLELRHYTKVSENFKFDDLVNVKGNSNIKMCLVGSVENLKRIWRKRIHIYKKF